MANDDFTIVAFMDPTGKPDTDLYRARMVSAAPKMFKHLQDILAKYAMHTDEDLLRSVTLPRKDAVRIVELRALVTWIGTP